MRRANAHARRPTAFPDAPTPRKTATTERARTVITRSSKHFRGKFPSRKCGRTIHWESLYERDAVRWFEYHPGVQSYREQPTTETYFDALLEPQRYFPDFEVLLTNNIVVHIEVKPAKRLAKREVKEKYDLIARHYAQQGRHFRLLTEEDLRKEPMRSNVHRLREYSKHPLPVATAKRQMAALGDAESWGFNEAAERIGMCTLLCLIANGYLYVNLNVPMEGDQRVWAKHYEEVDHDAFYL
jgi:TnsA endonuclease N terminal